VLAAMVLGAPKLQRHFEHVNTTCFNEKYTIKVLLYAKVKNLL
jgi:hypothetical protein